MVSTAELLRRLVAALQALAVDAEVQISLLPSFVCVADELALNLYDVWLHKASLRNAGVVSAEAEILIDELDELLARMSANDAKGTLWSIDSLEHASEWSRVRELSRRCLSSLGQRAEKPELDWLTFVRTDGDASLGRRKE